MKKKFNSFLLSLGIIITLISALLQFFISIHLFILKKYLYFIFYFIVFIYWLKDRDFKLKYFLIYAIISFYFNFSLTTSFAMIFIRTFLDFLNLTNLAKTISVTLIIGTLNTFITSFIYQFLKIKSFKFYNP